jgi:polar amino acid transport system permease protein
MPVFGINQLIFLLQGAEWTIILSLLAFAFGGMAAFIVALARISANPFIRAASSLYVKLVQGCPLMVLMLVCYFGFNVVGLDVPALIGATIAMTLYVSAFLGEVWRGCLESIPKAQWETSLCLGHSRTQRMIYIILPQAIRISIPPTVTFMVQIVKNTSLASIIGFVELTQAGKIVNNSTFQPFICFVFVAIIYFALCYPLSILGHRLERNFRAASRG